MPPNSHPVRAGVDRTNGRELSSVMADTTHLQAPKRRQTQTDINWSLDSHIRCSDLLGGLHTAVGIGTPLPTCLSKPIASSGQLSMHFPHPKHRSTIKYNVPFSTRRAPKKQLSSHNPQPTQRVASVTVTYSDRICSL